MSDYGPCVIHACTDTAVRRYLKGALCARHEPRRPYINPAATLDGLRDRTTFPATAVTYGTATDDPRSPR